MERATQRQVHTVVTIMNRYLRHDRTDDLPDSVRRFVTGSVSLTVGMLGELDKTQISDLLNELTGGSLR